MLNDVHYIEIKLLFFFPGVVPSTRAVRKWSRTVDTVNSRRDEHRCKTGCIAITTIV